MITRARTLLILLSLVYALPAGLADAQPLLSGDRPANERFSNPPADTRILKIVHNLPGTAEEQDSLFANLLRQGFGGVVANVHFAQYLESESNWDSFVRGVHRAHALGMAMWLYDEKGYPSGNAGGITLRDHPEWEAQGLYAAQQEGGEGLIELESPPGALVQAAAYPLADGRIRMDAAVDLVSQVRDGKLSWQAPAGQWHVIIITRDRLFEGTHATMNFADKIPYINLLMPEPTARFLSVTHDEYARRLGSDLGQWFVATFTDEPSLMSLFMQKKPWRPVPWSPQFSEQFQARRGYSIEPMLAALFVDAGPQGQKARYDFWLTVGELVSENFFGQIQQWCRGHGLPSGGHLLSEEGLLTHVSFYGDFFRCARRLDAPSIDCLTSLPPDVPWYIARLLGSVADLEGRAVTMSETSDFSQVYRASGDERPIRVVTEAEIRGTCNRQIVNGINTITSYYSFKDLTDEQLVRLNTWIGRCCTMLRGGHQITDVAVLYPVESIWPRFIPGRRWMEESSPGAQEVEKVYRGVCEALYGSSHDFTFIDSRTLLEGQVDKGRLCYNGLAWRIILLPCVDTLPQKAWDTLRAFWQSGGKIIAFGALPVNTDVEFPSAGLIDLKREVFGADPGLPNTNPSGGMACYFAVGQENAFSGVLESQLVPEVKITPAGGALHFTHRRIGGDDLFFIINDGEQPWNGQLHFAVTGPGEVMHPATGEIAPLASLENVPVALEGYGAIFVRFPAKS